MQLLNDFYGKCSKILNTSCLLKRPRQTAQTKIRMLLKKQSDQDLPYLLYSNKHFAEPSLDNRHLILEQNGKSV